MILEKRIRYSNQDEFDRVLTHQNDIFDRIRDILDNNGIHFVTDDESSTIECLCGSTPSDKVVRLIRDEINTSLLIMDSLIGMMMNGTNLCIFKR